MSISRGSAAFRVLSARNGVLASREIEPSERKGRHGRKFPFDENASSHPRARVVHRNAGGCGFPLSCCGRAARSAICPGGVGRVSTQGSSFLNRTSQSAHGRLPDQRDRGGGASLSVRDDRATRGWRRVVSEAGGWTVLARPGAPLSGRARGVVMAANDAAKRRSGCPPRYFPMPSPSLNSTSRVRLVRSPGDFGPYLQRGCWSVPSW